MSKCPANDNDYDDDDDDDDNVDICDRSHRNDSTLSAHTPSITHTQNVHCKTTEHSLHCEKDQIFTFTFCDKKKFIIYSIYF